MLRQMKFKNRLKSSAKNNFCILSLLLFYSFCLSQQNKLKVFQPLIGKTWIAKTDWQNGKQFKLEMTYIYSLDSTIVIANSKGFIDKEQTKFSDRNHGIRQWDKETRTIKFWEFDVFGSLTTGEILVDGKNMRYEYQYDGAIISDYWEHIDDNTYNFTIGEYDDGQWKQKYLETQFKALKNK